MSPKSPWTILTDMDDWKIYMDEHPEAKQGKPAQLPCLVRLFLTVIKDPFKAECVPVYVYKQEADALAVIPADPARTDSKHPSPVNQKDKINAAPKAVLNR